MKLTRNDIIKTALRKAGVYDQADTIPAEDIQDAALALNLMVKEWNADPNMKLWQRREGLLFLNPGQRDYYLGKTVTSPLSGGTVFASTVFESYNASLSGSDITLENVISRPDNEEHSSNWGISGSEEAYYGTSDEDVSGRPDGTWTWYEGTVSVSSGNLVFTPTSASIDPSDHTKSVIVLKKDLLDKPLKINNLSRVRYTSDEDSNDDSQIDTPLELVALQEYHLLSSKYSSGAPTIAYYEPKQFEGRLRVWPNDDKDVHTLRVWFDSELSTFENLSDETEFPPEWYNALVWGLAAELAPEYALPMRERQYLTQMAQMKKMNAAAHDEEQGSIYFEMDTQGRQ